MFFHPAILALLISSVLISVMLVYSSAIGALVLRRWDIQSGSELQLVLERRTYLVSTVMTYALGFQLLSLFLFIYTVDHLAVLFVGAMCAAGSLNANVWGYPTLILKIVNFILAGLWLIVNFTDNRGYDYPLIRLKYVLLLLITPLIVGEMLVQLAYFMGLEPNIITSCCGTLFTSDAGGVTSGVMVLPHVPVEITFYLSMFVTLAFGVRFYRSGKGLVPFTLMNGAAFVSSIMALMSFISLYIYELPTHHCPFCILHGEYSHIGYPLYISILAGAVFGFGMAAVAPFRRKRSLSEVVPRIQKGLALMVLGFHGANILMVLVGVSFSNLTLHAF
jgi:hypothetical protein